MALSSFLDRFKKQPLAPKVPKAIQVSGSSAKKDEKIATEEKKQASPQAGQASKSAVISVQHANLILKPHVSEKAAYLADRGIYVFDVPLAANKVEVRKAIEALYKVDVTKVRTERGPGKLVRRGRIQGRRKNWKKALVEVKKGQSINLVEGV